MRKKEITKQEGLVVGMLVGYLLGIFAVISLDIQAVDGWLEYLFALPVSILFGVIGWYFPKVLNPVFYIFYFLPFQ